MYILNKKKLIYFLLIISILLSGLSYEEVEADFISTYVQQETTLLPEKSKENASKLAVSKGEIFPPEIRTEELINRSASAENLKTTQKMRQKADVVLYCCNCFERKSDRLQTYFKLGESFTNCSSAVIVRYIHRKDGKKDDRS